MKQITRPVLALMLLTLSAPALAHPGHGERLGFVAGLLHPLSGLDHLAIALGAGLVAARISRPAVIIALAVAANAALMLLDGIEPFGFVAGFVVSTAGLGGIAFLVARRVHFPARKLERRARADVRSDV